MAPLFAFQPLADGGQMTRDEFDAVCARLAHATHVVQWGDASVWKVGGKVFAIGGWSGPAAFAVTFKVSPTSFAVLKDLPGLRPAPYLASRGLSWIQRADDRTLSDGCDSKRCRVGWVWSDLAGGFGWRSGS